MKPANMMSFLLMATSYGLTQICLSSSLQTLQVVAAIQISSNTLLWFIQTELPPELPDENKSDVLYVIIGVLCFLLLCGTVGITALFIIKQWSKRGRKTLNEPLNVH